jgi:pyruvate/2-oxoglutarate dehydrogenase complex dihydrolipoamide acyltransferase (E2) component
VRKAERLIERALTVTETMELGSNAGLVVGVKGATIRAINESTGARLHVDDKGLLIVTGTEESVAHAFQLMTDIFSRRLTGVKRGPSKAPPKTNTPPQPAAAAPTAAPAPVPPVALPTAAPAVAAPAVAPPAQPATPAKALQPKVVWLWQGDHGEWAQYDSDMEKELERQHRKMAPDDSGAIAYFNLSGCDYKVKRKSNGHLVQINLQTRRTRAVKRKGAIGQSFTFSLWWR